MDIQYSAAPAPGRPFRFSIVGPERSVRIVATIQGKDQVFAGECPDPPCHEQLVVPEWAGGLTLFVTLTSANAEPVIRKIAIAEKDSSAGGLTAAV